MQQWVVQNRWIGGQAHCFTYMTMKKKNGWNTYYKISRTLSTPSLFLLSSETQSVAVGISLYMSCLTFGISSPLPAASVATNTPLNRSCYTFCIRSIILATPSVWKHVEIQKSRWCSCNKKNNKYGDPMETVTRVEPFPRQKISPNGSTHVTFYHLKWEQSHLINNVYLP